MENDRNQEDSSRVESSRYEWKRAISVSHHASANCSAAQGVVLCEACTTQLEREEVGDRSLANQRVKERLQFLIRLEGNTDK